MDEHFEWETGHAFKDVSDKQTSLNGGPAPNRLLYLHKSKTWKNAGCTTFRS
ncbi:hypothetical protein GGP95_002837 [Salinibacter ruber]|nr:hypothetical protein [Salinibacter ruber]